MKEAIGLQTVVTATKKVIERRFMEKAHMTEMGVKRVVDKLDLLHKDVMNP